MGNAGGNEHVGERELDGLETFLAGAPVLDVAAFSHTTAHHSYRLILEGGVGVIAKPADTAPEGAVMCHREAAAWVLARALRWPDLMATTVMRRIASPTSGDEVETSVQVIWPDYLPDADVALFSGEDIWRAAVVDAVIGHSDRAGHNWLAVPGSSPSPRLKLVDHGHCFPEATSPPGSTFYELRRGQDLPDHSADALNELVSDRDSLDRLRALLSAAAVEAVVARAETLLSSTVLEIFPP